MPLVRPRSSLSELVLPVSIWSAVSEELEVQTAHAPESATTWISPHRIDVVGTRELRLIDPARLGTKYFVTCRSSDEDDFRLVLAGLEQKRHVAVGTMLLGDEAVPIALKPVGSVFELFPVLSRPKSPHTLPLGALRIATIHMTPVTSGTTSKLGTETSPKLETAARDPHRDASGFLERLWK